MTTSTSNAGRGPGSATPPKQAAEPAPAGQAPAGVGPFETEAQARSSTRHLLAGATLTESASITGRNHRLLCQAAAMAGVQLGAYDGQIIAWLARWEPSTCAVVAGLITGAAGRALTPGETAAVVSALEVAAEYREYRTSLTCPACADHPAGLCPGHAADLEAVTEYRDLAARIKEATR